MGRYLVIIACSLLLCVDYCQSQTRVSGCFNLQFACADGRGCPSRNNNRNGVCDGFPDCDDASDENRCGMGDCTQFQYQCDNGNCVIGRMVCDGANNCGDNSDEQQCGSANLVGFIVGLTVGILVFVFGLLFCIFCFTFCCVYCAYRKHRTITSGPTLTTQESPKATEENQDIYPEKEKESTFS